MAQTETDNPEVASGEQEVTAETADFQPGELESFDYSVHEFAELTDTEQTQLGDLCRQCSRRDTAARRMEVEQAWEARLFKRGYQYLLPRKGNQGGWEISGYGSGKTGNYTNASTLHETNVYGAHCDILTSALVRDIPECRFYPDNPNYGPDKTAADKAEQFAKIFSRNNDLRSLHTQVADYLCTDGRVLLYTRMVLDGQRFGFEDEADASPVVPEDETVGAPPQVNPEEGQDEESESPAGGRKPRGREITDCFGKLEHKVPINTRNIHEMDFIQGYWDTHISRAKAKFPWKAKEIKPGGNGISEIELDRIARLNAALALPGTYVTGDTFNRDVTIQYNWLRPAAFQECTDPEAKSRFYELFPDGVLVIYAGQTFIGARNECMDDHLHIVQAFPGSGQNRIALMTKVLSVQKRLNNWLDLLNDFFVRTVPQKWMDSNAFDVEAIQARQNIPGGTGPFQRQPGVPVNELIFVEPSPSHQPTLPEFIQFFFTDYPEMLSGALPSLFGAESNTDTVGGISMQRDQALGRLASPWGALQAATAVYFKQGVQQAAKCREKLGQSQISESIPGDGPVTLEISDLKGNVLCFPESDSNFPETWIQRSSRFQQLMTEAAGNPMIMKLLSVPDNMKIAKDAVGLEEFDVPEAASDDQQIGEFELLLQNGPMPNPRLVQAQQQLAQAEQQAMMEGPDAVQQFQQMAQQAQAAMQQIPPQVSSVPVATDDSEDHDVHAYRCKKWMTDPEGRKYKNGTKSERAAYENIHLHYTEHKQMADSLKNPPVGKPPSVSISVDKMPPGVQAQFVEQAGVQAGPKDFAEQDAAETEQKITEKAADFGHGTTAPATPKPSSGKVQ